MDTNENMNTSNDDTLKQHNLLFKAIQNNKKEDVQEWLKTFGEPPDTFSHIFGPLDTACALKRESILQLLLKVKKNWSQNALERAATAAIHRDSWGCLTVILKHGIHFNYTDSRGVTALQYFIKQSSTPFHLQRVEKILALPTTDLLASNSTESPLLFIIIAHLNPACLKVALEQNMDPNFPDKQGNATLHQVPVLLYKNQASGKKITFHGWLHRMQTYVPLLLKYGADLHQQNHAQQSAFEVLRKALPVNEESQALLMEWQRIHAEHQRNLLMNSTSNEPNRITTAAKKRL